jgi:CRISPR-associated protein Csb2
MALVIEQQFLLGRFHATRWNQNPFEDPYGEWPPSPWRLLRALAARWFQHARESGDADEKKRNGLLQVLAGSLPSYYLPPQSWRGPEIRQYHPTAVEEQYKYKRDPQTKKQVLDYKYREVTRTLVTDHYRAVPIDEPVLWFWSGLELNREQLSLLDSLLSRTLYFGRAESFCRMRRLAALPKGVQPNCTLDDKDDGHGSPVLVPARGQALRLDALLDPTDGKVLGGSPIPSGTAWHYARTPTRPRPSPVRKHSLPAIENLNFIQFAVGGRVYPPQNRWVKVTERLRGRVLRQLSQQIAGSLAAGYRSLTAEQRQQLALMAGKDGDGKSIQGHRHAFFILWADYNGLPTRLIVWRRDQPFSQEEARSLLQASENPISWETGAPDWSVRLVPLPISTPLPKGFRDEACVWVSATPFVPPSARHRFRENGRARPGETPERAARRLLRASGLPDPINVSVQPNRVQWFHLHETREFRRAKRELRTPLVRPGFDIRLEFDGPVRGPIMLGDSCHFGLGLFRAALG